MKTKNLLLIAIAVLSLFGCKYNDEAIWDAIRKQEERITALETWQKQASDEIAILKAITDESDYILSIVPVMEGGTQKGYTITFKKYGTITLLNSQKGISLISLKQEEDGNWYWTLNGSLVTDANGEPIRANGNPVTPQLKTGRQLTEASIAGTWQDDALYLSVDNGKTWNKVSGDKDDAGTGSSIKITEDDPNYVTFEVDGQKIKVQLYDETLSLVIEEDGRVVLRGEERSTSGGAMMRFKVVWIAEGSSVLAATSTGWTVNKFTDDEYHVYPPSVDTPPTATLTFMVTNYYGKKSEYPISLRAYNTLSCNADNLEAMLKKYPDVKNLKVSGTLTSDHMDKIKKLPSLKEIDLEDATLEGDAIPDNYFFEKTTLTTVKLPKGLKKIGANAFQDCSALSDITIGDQVTDLLNYAFVGCSSLTSINVPGSVKNIGESAFRNCIGLSTITIEEGLVNIGPNAFSKCTNITKITLPSTVKKMWTSVFLNCSLLGELRCLATTPPEFEDLGDIGKALGNGLPKDFKITVPSGSVDVYKNADGWNQYTIE